MHYPARLLLFLALAGSALPAQQPLTRVAASSLRLPANPPPTSYATARAFAPLTFTQPVALVTPPGDTRRLFVVEKPGRIWLIPDVTAASPTRTLFLDLTSRVLVSSNANDERGLLALAFHPRHATNGEFFVWYTTSTTTAAGGGLHNRLARFRVSPGNPDAADLNSEEPLLSQRDDASNHNGGELLFGPDGYLYLSLGDEGGGDDQYQNSQRIDRDFFAGILRLDVDRRPGSLPPNSHPAVHAGTYAVPPDNPFVGATSFNGSAVSASSVRTEFWATGLRNPWRMAFDPATGRLWCADVGQATREEINVIVRGGNYGWSYREGNIAGPRGNPPAAASFIGPVWDYGRSDGDSVTGGVLYRGPRYADLHGHYLFADFVSGRIWALSPDEDRPVNAGRVRLLANDGGVSSFGIDPSNGDILLADLIDGTIKRLAANSSTSGEQFPATLSATGAFADTATLSPAAGLVGYEPNVSFWSDHAVKRRWFALRDATSTFGFATEGPWSLPTGAVWVKHFDLELTRGDPATARRVETRFIVKSADGIYGLSYRWNDAQTDATLVPDEGADQVFTVIENGSTRSQTWRFPSRAECLSCHTAAGGHALSFNTRQLNRAHDFPGGRANILSALASAGYLSAAPPNPDSLPALAAANDASESLEVRARSYLDANCAHCHQPGGTALGTWDARLATPLSLANIVNGPLIDNGGDATNRVIVPGDPAHSRLLQRMSVRGPGQMPPVATHERDLAGETLLRDWIFALHQAGTSDASRIINLAARAHVGTGGDVLITGFVISPGDSKTVLVRAAGPALAAPSFGVAGALEDPVLTLVGPDSTTRVAATNDSWNAGDASTFAAVAAFPFPSGSRDAAIVANLAPGAYSAQLHGAGNTTGVALIEVYDTEPGATVSTARLVNTSVRAHVGVGANILIPGIVIGAGAEKTVLIRAVGPRLATDPFNVPGALAQPVATLFAGQQSVAVNSGWGSAANANEIRSAATRVGAFPLPEGSRDSALLMRLSAGAYTIQVSGADNTTGVALVEVYEVP